jgi:DNA polymerase-3 subunit gamma/tau
MAWALKYRPQIFSDVVGQEHVVVVIKAILQQYQSGEIRLPAGFIFNGTRGTGKTTTARVLAAVLNCDNPVNLEPCGKCSFCQSVRNSNCMFVHEVDAASTNSVEHVRKLKEIISLHHDGRVRVIILDEVHSFSDAAFQALLKPLEEPAEDTIFVLCTTEVDDIPETVLSRVMGFTYKRIVPEQIAARLQQIVVAENIAIADSRVLLAVAQKAQGGMRDAITSLEQVHYYCRGLNHGISLRDFQEYFGLVDGSVYTGLMQAARTVDIAGARKLISDTFSRGVDLAYFLDQFMRSVTEDMNSRALRENEAIECYRAATEVKAKLKYMAPETAIYYLFAMLLKMFHTDVSSGVAKAAVATSNDLDELFK